MADDERKLSYDELLAILKESTALEARRGPAAFSKKDLLDAAKQLGIDYGGGAGRGRASGAPGRGRRRAEAVRHAGRARGGIRHPVVDGAAAPAGRPDARTARAPEPSAGVRGVLDAGAADASVVFSLFSLPFWAAGIGITTRTVLPLLQRTRLTLTRDAGELTVRPLGKRRAPRPSELRVSLGENVRHRPSEVVDRHADRPSCSSTASTRSADVRLQPAGTALDRERLAPGSERMKVLVTGFGGHGRAPAVRGAAAARARRARVRLAPTPDVRTPWSPTSPTRARRARGDARHGRGRAPGGAAARAAVSELVAPNVVGLYNVMDAARERRSSASCWPAR